jgi:hypothetical protein
LARQRVRSTREVSFVLDETKLQQIIKANEGKPTRYIIADGVNYGLFVEMGTSRSPAQPFLVPAFNKVQFGLPPAIGRAIETGVDPYEVLKKGAFDIQRMAQENAPVDTGALKGSLHVETE